LELADEHFAEEQPKGAMGYTGSIKNCLVALAGRRLLLRDQRRIRPVRVPSLVGDIHSRGCLDFQLEATAGCRTMTIDSELLARVQFAFTVSFHIIFPTMSIGLAAFLAVVEGLWLKAKDPLYLQIYRFC
jgi:Cytochrome bd terminal oxidase subunit I